MFPDRADRPGHPSTSAPPDRPPAPTGSVGWLPQRLPLTDAAEQPLPADHAVGVAGLVYLPRVACDRAVVVLPDGKRYQVPARMNPNSAGIALSPNGRWLAFPTGHRDTLLRDLAGVTTTTLPNQRPMCWSTDSRWLVLMSDQDLAFVVDLRADTPTAPRKIVGLDPANPPFYGNPTGRPGEPGAGLPLVGILGSGELVFAGMPAPGDITGHRVRVAVTDADAQRVLHDWTSELPGGTALTGSPACPVYADAAGEWIAAGTGARRYDRTSGVVVLDNRTGGVRATHPLPAPRDVRDSQGMSIDWDFWAPTGIVDGDLLMEHVRPYWSEIGVLDRTTGQLRSVCVLERSVPGRGAIVVRGTAF